MASSSRKSLWIAGGMTVGWPMALLVDLPVARYCLTHGLPGDLHRVLTWSEVIAHGAGVAILGLTMYVLDPARRAHLPRLLATAYLAGLAADVAKLLAGRLRPRHADLQSTVWDTFVGWLPAVWPIDTFERMDSRLQSFPSAHTAVAVAFMFGLSRVYPRGRHLFAGFAILAAAQRIGAGAHFVTDTVAGAVVGALVATLMAGDTGPGRWFRRFEDLGGRSE